MGSIQADFRAFAEAEEGFRAVLGAFEETFRTCRPS